MTEDSPIVRRKSRLSNGLKRFRTEEDMLEYYELKAADHLIDKIEEEENKDSDEDMFVMLEKQDKHKKNNQHGRERSDSLRKNIKTYERLSKKFN